MHIAMWHSESHGCTHGRCPHRSASCFPTRIPTASSAAAAVSPPGCCEEKSRTHSAANRSMHTSAHLRCGCWTCLCCIGVSIRFASREEGASFCEIHPFHNRFDYFSPSLLLSLHASPAFLDTHRSATTELRMRLPATPSTTEPLVSKGLAKGKRSDRMQS